MTNWKDKALAATRGSQFGAILRCAFDVEREAKPRFCGKATITSDGFVMCDFVDLNGGAHWGAFVGDFTGLDRNVEGLAKHLALNSDDHNALTAAVTNWIATDYR